MISAINKMGKNFVRRLLKARGLEIVRPTQTASNGSPIPLLKLLIEQSITVDGKGAILQVGANDGLYDDPVHEIIAALNLSAILVEPLPDLFERLQKNYADQPHIYFENCAVSTQPGKAEIFRFCRNATHLPEWTQGMASFDKSILLKHSHWPGFQNIEQYIESVSVPVVTVGQLLRKHPDIKKIVALQIDTEGHDFDVVKSAVEAGCLPKIINYEHRHLSYLDQVACRELLSSHGYCFLSNAIDTLALRMRTDLAN